MINRKHILISIVLISTLFMSQMAVLVHSVEHPFHTPDQSCQVFFQYEKSGDGLLPPSLQFSALPGSNLLVGSVSTRLSSFLKTVYFARAPPLYFL